MAKSNITTAPQVDLKALTTDFKPTVRTVQLHAAPDLIGSKGHADYRTSDIYELPHGLMLVSKKTKRKVIIPYANIRAYELLA